MCYGCGTFSHHVKNFPNERDQDILKVRFGSWIGVALAKSLGKIIQVINGVT